MPIGLVLLGSRIYSSINTNSSDNQNRCTLEVPLYQEEAEVLLSARYVGPRSALASLGNSKAKQLNVQSNKKDMISQSEVKSSSTSSISAIKYNKEKPVSKQEPRQWTPKIQKQVPMDRTTILKAAKSQKSADRSQLWFERRLNSLALMIGRIRTFIAPGPNAK